MQCDCQGDKECQLARHQIESCRASVVYATRYDTVVSCTEAQWICMADAECAKALEYYNFNCKAMFRGKRCNQRCKNSMAILSRQAQAMKLADCRCEYNERIGNFYCSDIKRNMAQLCDSDLQQEIQMNVENSKRLKQEELALWESTSVRPPAFEWPEPMTEEPFEITETVEIVTNSNNVEVLDQSEIETNDIIVDTTMLPETTIEPFDDISNEIPLNYEVDDPEDFENEITEDQAFEDPDVMPTQHSGSLILNTSTWLMVILCSANLL